MKIYALGIVNLCPRYRKHAPFGKLRAGSERSRMDIKFQMVVKKDATLLPPVKKDVTLHSPGDTVYKISE
jgi:hypothetical protein